MKNGVKAKYSWNYGPSKLLFHFIEYILDQLNNSNHTKTAVNLTIQFFVSRKSKEMSGKVFSLKFFGPPPQNDRPVKF